MVKEFKSLYKQVFDENGNIKACGRETCIELIRAAAELDGKTKYGNLKTGFMNIDNLKALYEGVNC